MRVSGAACSLRRGDTQGQARNVKTRIINQVLSMPRASKQFIALFLDATLCVLCVHLAFFLRVNEWADPFGAMLIPSLVSIAFALPLFAAFGLYRAIIRYYGAGALLSIIKAIGWYGVIYTAIYSAFGFVGVPRTIGVLQPILLGLFVVGVRAVISSLLTTDETRDGSLRTIPKAVIYGAGASGRQLASALRVSGQVNVVAFLDDDPALSNATINGMRVWQPEKLDVLVDRYGISDVLLAINKTSRSQRNAIMQRLTASGLHIRTIPGVDQLARGLVSVDDLRDFEIEDLLRREPVPPVEDLLHADITGKSVLVTGAGGSIGSEICRQIARLEPTNLILIDANEFALYSIYEELKSEKASGKANFGRIVPLLANVRDTIRIGEIFATFRPETVYHAAAYKHVPLVEHNIIEGVSNNVLGSLAVAQMAREYGVHKCVLISTDKAVRPTNVMGATKRLSELVFQALSEQPGGTVYSMVRFGNVLGSSGSVIPRFREQIAADGPVTVTHPDITRFFMTIPEAAQLVIQAGAMAQGGDVFVLDMGEPVKIVDLARAMIELSGKRVGTDTSKGEEIAIEFVGLRPGEKLYEELLIGDDTLESPHPRVFQAREPFWSWSELDPKIAELTQALDARDPKHVRSILKDLVVEFTPDEDIVDWVATKGAVVGYPATAPSSMPAPLDAGAQAAQDAAEPKPGQGSGQLPTAVGFS